LFPYYYNGQQLIETRNGSDQTLKQHVWGLQYIDELVQIAINTAPTNNNNCVHTFYVCQDANFNVMGVLTRTGRLIERYEYTPYGQRTIYSHAWYAADFDDDGDVDSTDQTIQSTNWGTGTTLEEGDANGDGTVGLLDLGMLTDELGEAVPADDPLVMQPHMESYRNQYHGVAFGIISLCDIGHQGLMHDKETGLIYNRRRMLHPRLARFMQRDPIGYVDGMSLYEYVRSGPVVRVDPLGLGACNMSFIGEERSFDSEAELVKLLREHGFYPDPKKKIAGQCCDETGKSLCRYMIKENTKWVFIAADYDDFLQPTLKGITFEKILEKLAKAAAKKASKYIRLGGIVSKFHYARLTFAKKIKIELRDYDCGSDGKWKKEHVTQTYITIVKTLAMRDGGESTEIVRKGVTPSMEYQIYPGQRTKVEIEDFVDNAQDAINDIEDQAQWENHGGLPSDPSPEE